jgi:hypothetical protein
MRQFLRIENWWLAREAGAYYCEGFSLAESGETWNRFRQRWWQVLHDHFIGVQAQNGCAQSQWFDCRTI